MKTRPSGTRVSFRNTLFIAVPLCAALVLFQNCAGFGPSTLVLTNVTSQLSSIAPSTAATPTIGSAPATATPSPAPLALLTQTLRNQPLVLGSRLRIGSAAEISYAGADPSYLTTLSSEYNIVTPENSMKMDATQPTAASALSSDASNWNFSGGDALVRFAQSNNIVVRGHNLVWNEAIPTWLSGGHYTPDQLKQIMLNRIQTEMTHFEAQFPGQIAYWDVVNEAVGAGCSSIWSVVDNPTGDSSQCLNYVTTAFQAARSVASSINPKIKLFYNDYGAEGSPVNCAQTNVGKSCSVYALVSSLKSKGIIDGVGLQMHWGAGANYPTTSDLKNNMAQLGQLGLEVQITELDDGLLSAPTAGTLFSQGQIYQSAITACLAEANCTAVLTWGFNDPTSWLLSQGKYAPLVFDSNHARKWSYFALQDALGANPGSGPLYPQSNTSFCLDIAGGGTELAYTAGATLQIYGCDGLGNQSLYYDRATQQLKAWVNTPQELCVQPLDGHGAIGATMVLAACASSSIQKFFVSGGQLQDSNSNCLTASSLTNGALPAIATCSASSKWTYGASFNQNFVITSAASGLCMTAAAGSVLPATPVDTEACGPIASRQAWTLAGVPGKAGVQIVSGLSNLCLDVGNQLTVDETPVQQYGCAAGGQSNQLWSVSEVGSNYRMTSIASGKCLTLSASGGLVIRTCTNGDPSQSWSLK